MDGESEAEQDVRESAAEDMAAEEMNRTWAGLSLLEEIQLAEMRAILAAPLVEKSISRKALAAELGISVYMLTSFLDGATLRIGKDWDNVAAWCSNKKTPHVSPYVVAIGVLCHWFPPKLVGQARRSMWAAVRRMYASKGVSIPPFASEEIDALFQPHAVEAP